MQRFRQESLSTTYLRAKLTSSHRFLGLNTLARETGDIIAIGINFESPSMKKKDIIKVENLSFTRDMLNVVALIAPFATVTRIANGQVIEKHKVQIPNSVGDIVVCPDRFCITNHEEVPGKFLIVSSRPAYIKVPLLRDGVFRTADQVQGEDVEERVGRHMDEARTGLGPRKLRLVPLQHFRERWRGGLVFPLPS